VHKQILWLFVRIFRGSVVIFAMRKEKNNNYKTIKNMETKEKVLATMKEAGTPLNAGKIAELSGLDKKEVDKAMKQLKEEGAIVSPVRCKWAPAE
jgi:biotin operon repressor